MSAPDMIAIVSERQFLGFTRARLIFFALFVLVFRQGIVGESRKKPKTHL